MAKITKKTIAALRKQLRSIPDDKVKLDGLVKLLGEAAAESVKKQLKRERDWFIALGDYCKRTELATEEQRQEAEKLLSTLLAHLEALPKGKYKETDSIFAILIFGAGGGETGKATATPTKPKTAKQSPADKLLEQALKLVERLSGSGDDKEVIGLLSDVYDKLGKLKSPPPIVAQLLEKTEEVLENARRSGAPLGETNLELIRRELLSALGKPAPAIRKEKQEAPAPTKKGKSKAEELFGSRKPGAKPAKAKPSAAEAMFGNLKPGARKEKPLRPVPPPIRTTPTAQPDSVASSTSSIREEMLDIFIGEAEELLDALNNDLLFLEESPTDVELKKELMRTAHTLKGAAAMLGFKAMSVVSKHMEDILSHADDNKLTLSDKALDTLFHFADVTALLLDEVTGGKLVDREALDLMMEETREAVYSMDEEEGAKTAATALARKSTAKSIKTTRRGFRVDPTRLDTLLNLAGELVITRTRLTEIVTLFSGLIEQYQGHYNHLRSSSIKMRDLAEANRIAVASDSETIRDFSAMEFDRFTEYDGLNRDMAGMMVGLDELTNDNEETLQLLEDRLVELSLIANQIQDEVTNVRMEPFGSVLTHFRRAVRDTARYYNKDINFVTAGEETAVDKKLIDEMITPLTHLLRNAIAHGIETKNERVVAGKNEEGRVELKAYHLGNQVVIEVFDNGAGISRDRISRRAEELGLYSREELYGMNQDQLYRLLFLPNFSTSKTVDETSGRGYGLNIVEQKIAALRGSVEIESATNEFTRFTIRLPLTLGISVGLFVRVGKQSYTLPLSSVEETLVLNPEKITKASGSNFYLRRGEALPLIHLNRFFGVNGKPTENGEQFIVVVQTAGRLVALSVDELLGKEEMVIKPMGSLLRKVTFFSGATTLGDGSVALIINPEDFAESVSQTRGAEPTVITAKIPRSKTVRVAEEAPKPSALRKKPATTEEAAAVKLPDVDKSGRGYGIKILLVDDSVSIRNFVSRMLIRQGMDTETASDGLEALAKLEAAEFDCVLTDLEMPRMHGYELISEIKASAKLKHIPVMILTARAGEKHRQRAHELGVDLFHTKPFNEEKLVDDLIRMSQGK
ncbi:response regulator [bacterium]|nr:response regulator [bacterium]